MDKTHILALFGLCFLLLLALGGNYYLHRREVLEKARKQLIQKIKTETEQILSALITLKQINCDPRVIEFLSNHSAHQLERMRALDPESGLMEQLTGPTANNSKGSTPPPPILSKRAINNAQNNIRYTGTLLQQLTNDGKIPPAVYGELRREMIWQYCKVEIDAHLTMGKKMLNSKKISIAASHFKQARSTLSRVSSKDPRRIEVLAEIDDLAKQATPFRIAFDQQDPA